MLDYLGISANPTCGECDACNPHLPRPWANSDLTQEHLVASIPKEDIALRIIDDMAAFEVSRNNVVRALTAKGGRSELSEPLRKHPSYGQLSLVGTGQTNKLIDRLIHKRLVIERQAEYHGTRYTVMALMDSATRS